MTTAHRKTTWIWLTTAGVTAAAAATAATLLGGCTRVNSAWSALTAPSPAPAAPIAPAGPEPVAQGEDGPVGTSASANAPSAVESPELYPTVPPEPVKIPDVNMFGELDGHGVKPRTDAADFGFQQHTFNDEGYDADVRVDPTGKWICFASTRHSERPEIYLQRVDGTSVTQLTSDPSENAQPCFSPDGRSIAFCSTRAGSWDLYVMDIDGRNVTQVTSGPSQDMHPTFSPDGTRLAYCSFGGRSAQWEIWTINLTTRERKMVAYGLFPSWSPDKTGDRLAFQRARQRGSRWFSLWTLDLVDGEARRITEVAVSSNAAIISPSWSPDGRRLAFSTVVDPAQTIKGRPRGQQDVWIVDADGGNRLRLTDGTSTCLSPCWASDNRVYFVSDRGGHENVWSVRAEASSAFPVASAGAQAQSSARRDGEPAGKIPPKTTVGSTDTELEK
jgi:Tol biopolymer transport system component